MSKPRFCAKCGKRIGRAGTHKTCVQCDMAAIADQMSASRSVLFSASGIPEELHDEASAILDEVLSAEDGCA